MTSGDTPFLDRPLPAWYDDAKFGIFVHWGPYSVPCFAPVDDDMGALFAAGDWAAVFRNSPYTEWYLNTVALEGSSTNLRHPQVYGDIGYERFVAEFVERCRDVDLDAWADLFAFAGARYVVPTTKHHDGFLMWNSRRPNPHREGWMAGRDLAGDLATAVRARGLRFGTYYSGGIDWTFVPPPIDSLMALIRSIPNTDEYAEYVTAHVAELVERYEPSILWNDIGWPARLDPNDVFRAYYERVPDGVVNDRFNLIAARQGTLHADVETPEYSTTAPGTRKWETCRGIGRSFGYNRNEPESSLLDPTALIRMLVDVVARGGNLLLNVGPTADGLIPAAQAARLTALGWWLRQNGAAVYGTRPWARPSGSTGDGHEVRFTRAGDDASVFAVVLGTPPGGTLRLEGVRPAEGTEVRMLGNPRVLPHAERGHDLVVELPDHLAEAPAVTFSIAPPPASEDAGPTRS
jgi:alpha-L-fucosidase